MNSNHLTKEANQSCLKVIEAIRAKREVSRRVIATETGLSTPSITRLVNELMDAKVLSVHESTTVDGAGPGRPASVVKLNPSYCCAIGVDVGEHVIQAALGDMSGKIQLTSRMPTDADKDSDATFLNLINGIKDNWTFRIVGLLIIVVICVLLEWRYRAVKNKYMQDQTAVTNDGEKA